MAFQNFPCIVFKEDLSRISKIYAALHRTQFSLDPIYKSEKPSLTTQIKLT